MSTLTVKVVLFLPIAILYGVLGMAIARIFLYRVGLQPHMKRWLFRVFCLVLFSPVVVLTPAIGEFVVPSLGSPFAVFLWHPINLGSVLLYAVVCFYFSNRWFGSSMQAESSMPWRWPTFWRWFLSLLVALPAVAGLSLVVPPLGYLVATLWISSPLGTILVGVATASVVSALATILSASSGPPNSQVQPTPGGAADLGR